MGRAGVGLTMALGGALGGLLFAARAEAQACCAGASTLSPARLTSLEDAALGVQLSATAITGSFDSHGQYAPNPAGSGETDLVESLFATLKIFGRGQVTLLVPFDETFRSDPGLSEWGGGIGDVNLSLRWDFVLAKEVKYWPGVALLAGGTAPTGRTVENSGDRLATNATGIGAWQGTGGIALEQSYGPILINLTGLLTDRTSRDVVAADSTGLTVATHETLGLQFTGIAAVGYAFRYNAAVALIAQTSIERDPVVNGVAETGLGRQSTSVGISGGAPLGEAIPWLENWRVQGSLTDALPFHGFGQGQPVGLSATLALLRSFDVW